MKHYFSLGSAAVLSLTLFAGTPSFGKGGHGHGGGSGHASGGHAHSSGHPGGQHHSSGHAAPSHSSHPQLTHNSPTHSQTHSRSTHPQPKPAPGTAQPLAEQHSTLSRSFTHADRWHHGHHEGWGAGANGVALPWDYNPYWNGPGVVVVPTENEIIEEEYVTRVSAPPPPVSPVAQPLSSLNSDGTAPAQTQKTP
jgi:hypothetical protein